MINRLYTRDFAILKELELEFMPGFTIITGETGAGKSILLQALSLALGAKGNKNMVKSIFEINENIEKKNFTVIDARSKERFNGSVPDPRKNVRSGSIPNSVCLPFKEIINSSDNTFKGVSEISKKFSEIIDLNDDKRVFSCGSGITACVLGLAYSLVNNTYSPTVYDGSWAEYGRI